VIASSAFFVLDAILDWPVADYDGSWSQWGQLSGSAANGGTLRSDSIWRTDTAARSGLVVYNYATSSTPVFYTAATNTSVAVVNDPSLTTSGTFTGTANRSFRIEIDSTGGATDTFRWSPDGSTTWSQTLVSIPSGTYALSDGVVISFATTTGHTLITSVTGTVADRWDIITARPVELLSSDGGSCSSRLNLGSPTTTTFDPVGCMPIPPESQAASANQIEEEDTAYMAGGGGSSGGGGGAPIAPGY
jgi:hypothetical protein